MASQSNAFWQKIIYVVSALLAGAVFFLIYGPRPPGGEGLDVSMLPVVNASFNALSAALLVAGAVAVKRGALELHRKLMLRAFAGSAAFLVSYLLYHWFKPNPARYTGDFRGLYLVILITHIVLAAVILPLALTTLHRGWTGQLDGHRKIARITFPLWLYVSVTGVLIFLMRTA